MRGMGAEEDSEPSCCGPPYEMPTTVAAVKAKWF
jgi:hypothetical protein